MKYNEVIKSTEFNAAVSARIRFETIMTKVRRTARITEEIQNEVAAAATAFNASISNFYAAFPNWEAIVEEWKNS